MTVRILHISDVHGLEEALRYALTELAERERVDLVVFSGDLEVYGEGSLQSDKPLLAVSGNMDDHSIETMLNRLGVNVGGRCVETAGIKVCGISGLYPSRDAVSLLAALGNQRVDVLVSHYPPRGTDVDRAYTGAHIGKSLVNEVIEAIRPKVCLCGHVHEARGVCRLGSTLVVNPGPLSMGYYAVVELQPLRVRLKRAGAP